MKFSKKGIILLLIALAGLSFIIFNYSQQADQRLGNAASKTANSQKAASLDADGKAAKAVFEKTLQASNEEDADSYVACLIPKARKNTKTQLSKFFKEQDVTNTLQSYQVLKKKDGHLLAEAKVKSINNTKDQKKYRDNIATLNVSSVKQDGKWLIDLTTTIDTQLLKK
ncbi:hypothetical protein [Lactovum odontotermitis]